MSLFFKAPTSNYVQTTLNGSITDSDVSITLTDASKLQAPGYIVIDRLDANGVSTPASREVVYFTGISTNTLTGCQRGADNTTAQSHSDGARVDTMLMVGMWNNLVDIVDNVINVAGNGIHVATATITGSLNVSGASVVGIDVSNLTNITVTGSAVFQNIAVTSLASIAKTETSFVNAVNGAFTSIASIARVESGLVNSTRVEYSVAKMALNSNASGGIACDFDTANLFTRVLNASTTISLTNWSTGDKGVIRLVQGISGATVSWNPGSGNTLNWAGGVTPTLTYLLNKVDTFGFIASTDTTIDGFIVGLNR